MANPKFEFLKHIFRFNRQVYLDNNATTPLNRDVQRKMNKVLKRSFGNPSAVHSFGRESAEIIQEARKQVAESINAKPEEICFTGCASESNNAVLKALSQHFYPQKKKIIATPIEHPSVINTLKFLETQGIVVEYCPIDNEGRVILPELEKQIDKDTFLLCCMLANNEIGTIQDVEAVVGIAKKHNVLVLSDAVQAFGKIPIDVHKLGVNYASFSAHKLYGPKGVGALYVKEGSPITPFIHGGSQELGLRAGTESVHNIAGFGVACKNVPKLIAHASKTDELRHYFIQQLKTIYPECKINSPKSNCLPNTISVSFTNHKNSELLAVLDYKGIAVSAGSACSAKKIKPSFVLKAVGLTDDEARGTLRISLGHTTTLRDIRYTLKILKAYFEGRILRVKRVSPAQLKQSLLENEDIYLLDVRLPFQRKQLKSMPNAHEASFISIRKYLSQLPREKSIVVICQNGHLSFAVAYYLKAKGFDLVSDLIGGIAGFTK